MLIELFANSGGVGVCVCVCVCGVCVCVWCNLIVWSTNKIVLLLIAVWSSMFFVVSWGSSLNLATDWTTGVWSPAEEKNFYSSLCVQASSDAYPTSCPLCTGGPFPPVKRGRRMTLSTHPIWCRGQEWVGAISLLTFDSCMAVVEPLFFLSFAVSKVVTRFISFECTILSTLSQLCTLYSIKWDDDYKNEPGK
jgi:hypothetical protein